MSPSSPPPDDITLAVASFLRRTRSNLSEITAIRDPSRGRPATRFSTLRTHSSSSSRRRRDSVERVRRRDLEDETSAGRGDNTEGNKRLDQLSLNQLVDQLGSLNFGASTRAATIRATTPTQSRENPSRRRAASAARQTAEAEALAAVSARIEQTKRERRHRRNRSISSNRENSPDPSAVAMASSNAFPPLDTSVPAGGNRSAGTSPITQSSVNGNNVINGPSAAAYMPPLPVGHQQDLNHLFNQIQELGGLLKSNRDKVNSITKNAEEVAKRANGALSDGEAASPSENDKAKIRELELELSKQKHLVELYKHEQKENTGLIAMYEEAMGTAVEQIRNYCGGIEARFIGQRKHYNDLLQQEKDDHLASRLDRDHWYAQTLKVCEMIRTAHRLRSDEWHEEYVIIAALQGEVRSYRRILGMDKQEPNEETGWPYLKDLPLPE